MFLGGSEWVWSQLVTGHALAGLAEAGRVKLGTMGARGSRWPAPDGWEGDFAGLSPLAFGGPHSPVTVIARYRYPSVTLSPVTQPGPLSSVTVSSRYRYRPLPTPLVISRYRYRPVTVTSVTVISPL